MTRRACAIVVRPPTTTDDGYKVPTVPGSWDVTPEADGWSTLYPLGRVARPDVFVHAWLACEASGSAAWLIAGTRARVDALVALASRAWSTLDDLRSDNGAVAVAVKAAWVARWGSAVVPARMAGFDEDDGEESP